MMGVSFNELLILAMLAGGPPYNDAVSFVPTAHYFQTRKIDPTVRRKSRPLSN